MASPLVEPQAEVKYVGSFPLATPAATDNLSAATAANAAAVVTLAADAARAHVIAGITWSYSADPTGGRLTIITANGTYIDLDITKGGPGFIPLHPPLRLDIGSAATIALAAAGAAVTGKVQVNCWRMK